MHIFHRWSTWKLISADEPHSVLQERFCLKCGKRRIRWAV